MSHLGEVFDSYRTAMKYMRRTDNDFGQRKVNQMLKQINKIAKPKSLPPQQLLKGNWTRDMALPEGWMVRREESQGVIVMVETILALFEDNKRWVQMSQNRWEQMSQNR